jgi:hypothetical protein
MGYFAGLDVSLEETTICVVDDAGKIVREVRAASEPDALVASFGACGMTMEKVGLEACSLTAWLHAGLTEAGIPAICIETRQANAAMGAIPNKKDRNDARGMAQIMRAGWYRTVDVKSPPCRSWRALLTARRMVLNKAARCRERYTGVVARGWTEGWHAKQQRLPSPRARTGSRRPGADEPSRVIAICHRGHDPGSRALDQARARRGGHRADVPATDDCARCRPADRVGVPRHHRPAGPLPKVARCRRPSRPDAAALSSGSGDGGHPTAPPDRSTQSPPALA